MHTSAILSMSGVKILYVLLDLDRKITQQMLKSRSGEFDIESIHTLSLPGMGMCTTVIAFIHCHFVRSSHIVLYILKLAL